MFGIFTVQKIQGEIDSNGFYTQILVKSDMNNSIEGELYLPPYLRQAQCGISIGSKVVGYLDDVSGLGCAFVGLGDADFQYRVDSNFSMNGDFSITGDIKDTGTITASTDVVVGAVSLNGHKHEASLTMAGEATPAGVVTGWASGSTNAPTGGV